MRRTKIAVMISGSGTNLQALIDEIHNKNTGGEIVLVISNRPEAYGLNRAVNRGIRSKVIQRKNYSSSKVYEEAMLTSLEVAEVDLIVLAGYLELVPLSVIHQYKNRIMNIHPSLIPSFCGKGFYGIKVQEAVIDRGLRITGATVHFVNEEMDEGPIILQRSVAVEFDDTAESLQQKVLQIEHEILPLAVQLFIENRLRVIGNRVEVMEASHIKTLGSGKSFRFREIKVL